MRYVYPCVLTPERNGGYSVSFPDVPEALTCGDDRDEALAMAEAALTVALGSYMQCREDIPVPDTVAGEQEMVAVPLVVAAKLALYTAMREQGLTKVGLGLSEGAVREASEPESPLTHRADRKSAREGGAAARRGGRGRLASGDECRRDSPNAPRTRD